MRFPLFFALCLSLTQTFAADDVVVKNRLLSLEDCHHTFLGVRVGIAWEDTSTGQYEVYQFRSSGHAPFKGKEWKAHLSALPAGELVSKNTVSVPEFRFSFPPEEFGQKYVLTVANINAQQEESQGTTEELEIVVPRFQVACEERVY